MAGVGRLGAGHQTLGEAFVTSTIAATQNQGAQPVTLKRKRSSSLVPPELPTTPKATSAAQAAPPVTLKRKRSSSFASSVTLGALPVTPRTEIAPNSVSKAADALLSITASTVTESAGIGNAKLLREYENTARPFSEDDLARIAKELTRITEIPAPPLDVLADAKTQSNSSQALGPKKSPFDRLAWKDWTKQKDGMHAGNRTGSIHGRGGVQVAQQDQLSMTSSL